MVNINNLFSLMNLHNISNSKLSLDTGISTGNISDWKSGRSFPSASKLDILADYFHCSTDYLLGRTNNLTKDPDKKTSKVSCDYPHKNEKEYIIAFIDLLGISKNILDNDINIVSSVYHLMKYNKLHTAVPAGFDEYIRNLNVKSFLFSDNLVYLIECPKDIDKTKKIIQYMCKIVSSLQCHALHEHELLLRGGITKGFLYLDEERNFILGKGLFDAYTIESVIANMPRILVDKKISHLFNDYTTKNYIRKDSDGELYINYLAESISALSDYNNIIDNKISKEKNYKILQKYNWAKEYHNRYIAEQQSTDIAAKRKPQHPDSNDEPQYT